MTDWKYIYRILVPTAAAQLSSQAADRDLHLIRRTLHYKIRSNARLNLVEQHLVRSFPELQNKLFAPSISAVALAIGHAFVKPFVACASFGVALAVYSPDLGDVTPESFLAFAEPTAQADAGPDIQAQVEPPVDLPQLAVALAAESAGQHPELLPPVQTASFQLPQLPKPVEQPRAISYDEHARRVEQLAAEAQLKQQRNLIRFISGIIAAFRPNIKDSGTISRHIVEISATQDIDPIYVAAVIAIESRFSSTAESHVGALGLMQLMPNTAREVANSKHHRTQHLVDPRTNIKLGISYLKQLEEKYRGNRFLALAAYNWGPANINKSGGKYKRIPGSVRKYSNTVLERTLAWRRHFDKATESADSLKTVSREEDANNS